MPAVSTIEESVAQGQVRELYKRIKESLGLSAVPNIFKAMAHNPAFLSDTLDNHLKTMGDGVLDRKTKELIALAVATSCGCNYTVAVHSVVGRQIGLTEAQVAEAISLSAIMTSHNHFQKFKDHGGDDAFKPLRMGMAESLLKQKSISDLQAELMYVCVSTINSCFTCVRYHVNKAKSAGATREQFAEALAVMNLMLVYSTFVKSLGVAIDIKS